MRYSWAFHTISSRLRRTQRKPPAITALHFEIVDGKNTVTTKFTADQIADA